MSTSVRKKQLIKDDTYIQPIGTPLIHLWQLLYFHSTKLHNRRRLFSYHHLKIHYEKIHLEQWSFNHHTSCISHYETRYDTNRWISPHANLCLGSTGVLVVQHSNFCWQNPGPTSSLEVKRCHIIWSNNFSPQAILELN